MVSAIQRALDAVRNQDYLIRGETVTYVPHNGSSYSVRVVPTAPRTEIITADGVSVDRRMDDFIVEVAGLQRLPERGDRIVYQDTDFMVSHPGGGREYDYHDSYHQSLRVHTVVQPKKVTTVMAPYVNAAGVQYANSNGVIYTKP